MSKTPFQLHVEEWKDCTECGLCEVRLHTVLAKGKIPCDVLFLGEAPGKDENIMASPFVGEAGRLLHQIIDEAVPKSVRCAFTNLIACIPLDDEGDTNKLTEPPEDSVRACTPRLQEFVEIANPRLIICVGDHAKWWTDPSYKKGIKFDEDIHLAHMTHPGAILRNSIAMRTISIRRCVVTVRNAIKEYLPDVSFAEA